MTTSDLKVEFLNRLMCILTEGVFSYILRDDQYKVNKICWFLPQKKNKPTLTTWLSNPTQYIIAKLISYTGHVSHMS